MKQNLVIAILLFAIGVSLILLKKEKPEKKSETATKRKIVKPPTLSKEGKYPENLKIYFGS